MLSATEVLRLCFCFSSFPVSTGRDAAQLLQTDYFHYPFSNRSTKPTMGIIMSLTKDQAGMEKDLR
jgi:hypothetical protein